MTDPSEITKEQQAKLDELNQSIAQVKLTGKSIERQMELERTILTKQIHYQKAAAYVKYSFVALCMLSVFVVLGWIALPATIIAGVSLCAFSIYSVVNAKRIVDQSRSYYDDAIENELFLASGRQK